MNWAGDFVTVSRRARELPAQAPFALPELIITTVDLPYPVSTNRMLRYAKGRVYRSEWYTGWMRDADAHLLMQRLKPKKIRGAFAAHIYLDRQKGRTDIDNCKAVLDFAQSRGFIADDNDCDDLWITRTTADNAPYGCRLTLREMCA